MIRELLVTSGVLCAGFLPLTAQAIQSSADEGQNVINQEIEDMMIMTEIREQLTKNEFLSVLGRNIQILSQDGQVTLSGTVPTRMEAAAIERTAINVVGINNVANQMNIAE